MRIQRLHVILNVVRVDDQGRAFWWWGRCGKWADIIDGNRLFGGVLAPFFSISILVADLCPAAEGRCKAIGCGRENLKDNWAGI